MIIVFLLQDTERSVYSPIPASQVFLQQIKLSLRETKQIKVLVVDDSPLITKRIAAMIGELGCVSDVFTSEDYGNAVNIIDQKRPDVVLLDIHLPQKSGIDLLRYTRQHHPGVKILMVTNKASDYYRDLCGELGSHYFIDKSKEFEHIPGIIESYA